MNLKEVNLVYDYISKGMDYVMSLSNPIYKSLFKGKPYQEIYKEVLCLLRVPEVLEVSEDEVPLVHLELLVSNNIPLWDYEYDLYKELKANPNLDEVNLSIYSKRYKIPCKIPGMMRETGRKMRYTAKYILNQFDSRTSFLGDFTNNRIDGDTLMNEMELFLRRNYKLVPARTNIMIKMPQDIMKNDSIIYIPSSFPLDKDNPYKYMVNLMVEEYNDPSIGAIPGEVFMQSLSLLKKYGNFYNLESKEIAEHLYDLDLYSRICDCTCIQELTEGYINFGKPMEYIVNSNKLFLVGNYNETITAFTGNISFTVDKNQMSMLETNLGKGVLTTTKKVVTIKTPSGEKSTLWNLFYINSIPSDGNYNNLIRANVQV